MVLGVGVGAGLGLWLGLGLGVRSGLGSGLGSDGVSPNLRIPREAEERLELEQRAARQAELRPLRLVTQG